MTEEFSNILEKENEQQLLSFLRSLKHDDKKKLSALIKKLAKEYGEFGQLPNGHYGHIKGSDAKRNMLQIASFVCFNGNEYAKSASSVWMLEREKLSKVIDWCVPEWFDDFVNKQASQEYIPFYLDYDWIMDLTEKGALHPSKELIAKILPQAIFDRNGDTTWIFRPEKLFKRPVTLEEHIWYLFDVETNLNYSGRYLDFGNETPKEKIGWGSALNQYVGEGKIDRRRLLKECLLASNKNFNKVLSGWFAQLFMDLQPTTEELLHMQKELLTVLSSPNSKCVNTALQGIKKILSEQHFIVEEFLDVSPTLLASDTKSTVTSTMQVLEKISKSNIASRDKISQIACQVFIHPDEELQTRAAKLIAANQGTLEGSFRDHLAPYSNHILTSARKILGDDIHIHESLPVNISSSSRKTTKEFIELPAVKTKDDFIFLASQVFDNNEPWHIDQFVAACVKFRSLLRTDELHFLEPAFQRALNLTRTGLQFNMGFLENLNAMFCIDFGNYLIQNFPVASETIKDLYRKYDHKDGEVNRTWTVSPANSSYTEDWQTYSKLPIFQPHKQLLVLALRKIKQGDFTPLLSTPTHIPCWIDAKTLIDRISTYLEKGHSPDEMDLQIALLRCLLNDGSNAIQYGEERLSGELRNLVLFLLDENAEPRGQFTYKAAWMAASLAKKQKKEYTAFKSFSYYTIPFSKYLGQLEWECVDEEYTYDQYDYQQRKSVPVKGRRKIFRLLKSDATKKQGTFEKLFAGLLSKQKSDAPLLFDFLSLKAKWLSAEDRDIKRILFLIPNHPEPLLAEILNQCMEHPKFWSETHRKLVTSVLQGLYEIWDDFGEMAHVFIASCMISADRSVANIAGEIWINAVQNGKINNELLGRIIGKYESIEFAPLKRFTDLVQENLIRTSTEHDRALQHMIENILVQLPIAAVKNLRKLLEIYFELLVSNKSALEHRGAIAKLEFWVKSGATQKIASSLVDLSLSKR